MDLNELFALPIGLQKVGEFDGIELYGSDSLNKKIIESLSSSVYSKPILGEITKLIEERMLIPVFSSKGIIKYFSRKIVGTDYELKHLFAFFNPPDKKIYILVDNNSNIVGYINNDDLAKLVIHELIHKVSSLKPSYFLSKFKNQLLIFYKQLYKKLFKLNDSPELDFLVEDIYASLYDVEKIQQLNFKKLAVKFDKLRKYSTLSTIKFDKVLGDYFKVIRFASNREYNLLYTGEYNYILKGPFLVFKQKFGFFPIDKGCDQELFAPSEVISAIAENKPSELIYDSIRKITK